jgi:glycosyltransferase involved in cell wall biosynthesis
MTRNASPSVAIVCGAGIVSGKEIIALELAEGLRERGITINFLIAWWGDGEFKRRLQALQFNFQVLRLGFISATLRWEPLRMTLHQLWHLPGLLMSYRRFLRTVRPSYVIHCNWHHAFMLLPVLRRKRDIFWVHEIMCNRPLYRGIFRAISRRVRCFVAVSHATGSALQRLGIPQDRICVLYNGVRDTTDYGAQKSSEGANKSVGIIGQIGKWKGHEDLFDAFSSVQKAHPDSELHIYGRGSKEYEDQLRDRARQLGIEDSMIWHGFVADRRRIYRDLAVCVVPSHVEESFGLTALEASLASVPVVATRRGALPEIVEHGETGYLFEAGNTLQLAASINALLSDPPLAKAMGSNGRTRALQKFGRDRFINDFVNILNDSIPIHGNDR